MLLEPSADPVARPVALMFTIVGLEEAHVAVFVRFCVLPSLKVPVAVNCAVVPLGMEELPALTLIDCSVAAVTASAKLLDVIPLWVAVILLEPMAAPVARPVALMLTAVGLELAQVAVFVRFCVLPSLKVPVALNCTLVPLAMEELPALIAIDCNVAAVTVRAIELEVIPFWVAVMLLEPMAAPVARPLAFMLTAA